MRMEMRMKRLFLLLYLILLAALDWKERKVPLILLWGGGMVAVGFNMYVWLQDLTNGWWTLASILLGTLPGLGMLAVARFTGKAGYGDGLVLLNVGLLTDYKTCFIMLCFSMLLMSFFAMGMLVVGKVDKESRLPYIPFLTAVYAAGYFI